ncbi:MAG: O-antigen ligase family protein [Oscillospiraceae bacterium]|nr:O-antigen ligase family protein [Oscillospiraceae bacterium]
MKEKKSIWNREIEVPFLHVFPALPADFSSWAAFLCVSLFIISPFIVGALCLIHHSIDYTIYTHPVIFNNWIWPISALTGGISIVIELWQKQRERSKLRVWLRDNPGIMFFFGLVIWMVLSTCINGWNSYCLYGDSIHLRFETIFMQLGYFLIVFPAAILVRYEQKKRIIVRLHEGVCLFLAITAFVLWKTQIDSVFFIWTPRVTAIYSNINYYGYYLSVSIPLSAAMFIAESKAEWKVFSIVTLMVNTVTLSYNNTMGAWVACTFAMLFLLITHGILEHKINKQAVFVVTVYLLLLVIFGVVNGNLTKNFAQLFADLFGIATHAENSNHAGSGRWIIWKRALKLIADSPVFGIGFEGVCARGLKEYAKNTRVHNEYLQYTLFYGIPAGLFYLAGIFGVYIRALKWRIDLTRISLVCLTGAFGYLVSAFFGNTIFCTAPFLFVFLGMGYVNDNGNG